MQAPHSESSQPSLLPVRPSSVRTTESRLRCGLDLDRVVGAVHVQDGVVSHGVLLLASAPCSAGLAGMGTESLDPRARATAAATARRAITAAIARR